MQSPPVLNSCQRMSCGAICTIERRQTDWPNHDSVSSDFLYGECALIHPVLLTKGKHSTDSSSVHGLRANKRREKQNCRDSSELPDSNRFVR